MSDKLFESHEIFHNKFVSTNFVFFKEVPEATNSECIGPGTNTSPGLREVTKFGLVKMIAATTYTHTQTFRTLSGHLSS